MPRSHNRPDQQSQATPRPLLRAGFALFLALAGLAPAFGETPSADLKIVFPALKTHGGPLMLQIFDTESAFEKGEAPILQLLLPSVVDQPEFTLKSLPPGKYAFRVFHDLNGNGRLDANPFGMPTEPYAFSNNASGMIGPAHWADAAFTLTRGANSVQSITIE